MSKQQKPSATQTVREIKRKTRRKFSAEEKIRIVLEGLRGEDSVASICRKEGIASGLYYKWCKDFMEAGKKRLMGDTLREANTSEVTELRQENQDLKLTLAEQTLEIRRLKKSL
jgi:transposase